MEKALKSLALALSFGLAAANVGAATFVVNKLSDDNGACTADDCSIREAVLAANAMPGADTILLPPGRHLLSIGGGEEDAAMTGDLDILDAVSLEGALVGKTTIAGSGIDRIFDVFAQTSGQVFLRRLMITGGGDVPGNTGGGIHCVLSDLVIEDSEIVGNRAFEGGGLDLLISTVRIERSLIADNVAELRAGGIYTFGLSQALPVRVTLVNSTISGNVSAMGGGASLGGDNAFELINSTVAGNDASLGSAFDQEFTVPNALRFRNSLVEGTCSAFQGGASATFGGNIESPGDTCGLHDPSDQTGVTKLGLGPLDWNGGYTRSRALLAGSPAVDAGSATCEAEDQRGQSRPEDGDGDGEARCDAGAYELAPDGIAVEVPFLSTFGLAIFAAILVGCALSRPTRRGSFSR